MTTTLTRCVLVSVMAAALAGAALADPAVLEAHALPAGRGPGIVGSTHYQCTMTLESGPAPAFHQAHGVHRIELGFPSTLDGHDSDGDGTVDTDDPDSDGDGTPDAVDPQPYDFDADGMNNVNDCDDDNDGLDDRDEAAVGTSHLDTDTDDDGQDDLAEWIAGTRGNDPGSLFEIYSANPNGTGDVILRWWGVADRAYTLHSATALTGTVMWSSAGSTGATADAWIDYPVTAGAAEQFLRLNVTTNAP